MWVAMALIDSTAVFSARLWALGLASLQRQFDANGWNTYGTLVFACAFTPGGDDTPLASVVIPALNGGNTVFDARIRRIHFEAYASTMAEFQRRAQRGEENSRVQQVPPEERADRLNALKAKYPGLTVNR